MAKVSLLEKLQSINHLSLKFVGLSSEKTQDGSLVAILQLEEPIPFVRGSQTMENGEDRVQLVAHDVVEIKVHQENFTDDFEFDSESDTGTYEGDQLMLDVTKRGEVWLVNQSYRQLGNIMRNNGRNERLKGMMEKFKSARTSAPAGVQPVGG